jgi:hypothetical protein
MLTSSKNPLSQDQSSKLDTWLHLKEADTMTACVRAQMAHIQAGALKGLDSQAIAVLGQLDAATVDKLRDAARLGVFLEVWKEITSGKLDMSLIRIEVT